MRQWIKSVHGDNQDWHWCPSCPYYPEKGKTVLLMDKEPEEGSFCHVCNKLEYEGKCKDEDFPLVIKKGKN